MRILIVEDNEDSRIILKKTLEADGYQVEAAVDGSAALEKAHLRKPDMIISDILMPVMDGFQLCQKVMADEMLKDIPFVFYTATYTHKEDEKFALKLGADKFVQKPKDPGEFIKIIQNVFTDAKERKKKPKKESVEEEKEIFKLYSERLVNKLEKKMLQLQDANQALGQEIAERKLAEDELRQYGYIVSSTRDMQALVDNNFVYLAANAAYLQAFGKTSDEMIGRTVMEMFGEEFFSTVIRPRAERCLTGEDIRYQAWFEFPATGRKYMDAAYSPYFGAEDKALGFVITDRDITKLESLQAQLLQAQKMESVGRLAGGVAHDYNNALSAIIGFTELAMRGVGPIGPLRADLEEVLKAANRATDITRQLLAFARKQTIAPKVLDLNKNVESMLKMLQRLIGEDIDLRWVPGEDLWPVKMDPSQIDQILANLCVNARDAIEGVGKISIETDTVAFDAAYCADHVDFVPGEFVMLVVSDNGCSMEKKILDNIFEPFFTTKDVDKGTGLGLATVYGIVKQNNGFINVYSEPGSGTTIRIYLSRHEGEIVEIQKESTAKIPHGRGEAILLVEDDLPTLKLARQILDGLDYSVLTAGTPEMGISLAEEHTGEIHLLITDVIMPGMNGPELAEKLQIIYPNLKVLFMSGYTSNIIAHHGVLDEGINFIQKPFSRRDLAIIFRKALESEN